MSEPITEWEFVADVKSRIDQIIAADPTLPFSMAKVEQRGKGSLKRRDLTLLDSNGKKVLTGEVKLPYAKDGGTPYNQNTLEDARKKAVNAGVDYFFTWNVNEFVLWETFRKKLPYLETKNKSWKIVTITSPEQLVHPSTVQAIIRWLPIFLKEFATIFLGKTKLGILPLDDKFINELESFLEAPIQLTLVDLIERYQQRQFKSQLDAWMRDEQGWTISDDPLAVQDLLERAAKSVCYGLVIRLLFYEALMKRYGKSLDKLDIPDHIDIGERLERHLAGFFDQARIETQDYETVFPEQRKDIGARLPFFSDKAVEHWRDLVKEINRFDIAKLNYEVIGRMFERLIDPRERHKYGQYYTRPEIVDLINSFCIRTPDACVLDPACGGGTFLVRAYKRKNCLSPSRKHRQLISELYGIDVSPFATHLTTINLAIRDLIEEKNYPRVAREDYFNVKTGKKFLLIPDPDKRTEARSTGLGKIHQREIVIPPLDAIVGNPPYLRQEDIKSGRTKGSMAKPGTKEYYAHLVQDEAGVRLSGRSDLHCYFWPHARTFLKDDGWFGFLTSSQWLDVEYGFKLQEWVLKNYAIVAIIESLDEPWFVGARVATTVTILRCEPDARKRMKNIVRFVQLRAPIAVLLASDESACGPINAADSLRDELTALVDDTVTDRYRARLVPQRELWENGVRLGGIFGKNNQEQTADEEANNNIETRDTSAQTGQYYGGKWGVYLRAPDLWFELLDETHGHWTQLGEIAKAWFGLKSGKDIFFFVRDASSECLEKELSKAGFRLAFGIPRRKVESGEVKLVRCGKGYGEIHPIESEFLEPEVHSLMELDEFVAKPEDCARQIILASAPKSELPKYIHEYVLWGEENKWHEGSTCSSRVTDKRPWYDLTGHRRGTIFWPMAQQYRHLAPLNKHKLICNHGLVDISTKNISNEIFAGILNSTLVLISKYQFGRPVGVEGLLRTEIVDINMMLVPNPRQATTAQRKKVKQAFRKMIDRKVLDLLPEQRLRRMAYTQRGKTDKLAELSEISELDMPDRRELDDAVLELLGISSKKRRKELLNELYNYLREFFEDVRQKEEKAIENKKRAKRRGPATPKQIAIEILNRLREEDLSWLRFLIDFIPDGTDLDTYRVPEKGEPELHSDLFIEHGVRIETSRKKPDIIETRHLQQSKALKLAIEGGQRGLVRIPFMKKDCKEVIEKYEEFLAQRDAYLHELIKERTADEDMRDKIMDSIQIII